MNPKGIIAQASPYSVSETIDRLVEFLKQHGVTIYARIDQQSEVQKAGREVLPLEFLLFGNSKRRAVRSWKKTRWLRSNSP